MSRHLILRVHTDAQLGFGHVARALAIAEAWSGLGGTVCLAVSGGSGAERIGAGLHPWRDEPLGLEAAFLGPDLATSLPSDLVARAQAVLVDVWSPVAAHLELGGQCPVALYEDEGDLHEGAQLLFQPYLEGVQWPTSPVRVIDGRKVKPMETRRGGCRVLRGSDTIVVSPAARDLRPRREPIQPLSVHRLLVTFGGTDGPGLTERALEVIRRLMARGSYLGTCTLVAPRGIVGRPVPGCTVVERFPDLSRRILDHDAIWCAAGVTLADAVCLGVPAAAWGQNPRQQDLIADLGMANACLNLGLGTEADLDHTVDALERWLGPEGQDSRQEQTRDGMALIDGSGALRVAQALWTLSAQG